jgi:4-hydroxymandelate oxidase
MVHQESKVLACHCYPLALPFATIMRRPPSTSQARREFLKFMAASPYVAAFGGVAAFLRQSAMAQTTSQKNPANSDVIAAPGEALDVFDFEEAAHRKVRDSHWAYMVSGVDDDATLRANREGYQHVQLRPRRLRDATKVDMRVDLFGTVYDSPLFLCPTSAHKAFWPNGEEAVARAAKARGTLQFLSSASSTGVEDVNKALGRPVWYQVYAPSTWEACEQLLRRVEAAGCPVIALTVDNTTGRNSETYLRTRPKDLTQCAACHKGEPFTDMHELPMYNGINMNGVTILNPALDWAFAGAPPKPCAPRLRRCPKSWPKSADAFPFSWMAGFAEAPTFSRRSRWAPRPWESGAHIFGDWERSARPAWIACWKSCRAN